jgi:hypothetical protein
MTIRFYLIPMEAGPYSITNKQRPKYLDALQANWSGYPLFQWNRYLCQVNTTTAKHAVLESNADVVTLPDMDLDTPVSALPLAMRNRVQVFLGNIGIPYYTDETVGDLIQRIVVYAEFNLGNDDRALAVSALGQAKRDRIAVLMGKLRIAFAETEDLGTVIARARDKMWDPRQTYVSEF